MDTIAIGEVARRTGLAHSAIRSPDTPPPERWRQLAERKLPEVDTVLQRAAAMKRLLEKGLRCDCVSMSDCILHACNPPVQIGRARQRA